VASVIWDKAGASIDARIQRFCAGDDVVLDRALFLADVRASSAHVHGLARIGVLSQDEAAAIDAALSDLAADFTVGGFVLDDTHEDGHSAIEAYLTARLGETGKKVHTGRSRNDQVLVAQRLFVRDALAGIEASVLDAAAAFLARAEAERDVPMPGYTHLQRAVPSSVGLWLAAFVEAFVDDAALVRATSAWMDACPLGTAAGYGVNLPLDRQGVSDELGFARLLVNPMYAQNSRGKLELAALGALLQALFDVRRFAWDLSIYTTAEFAFVKLPPEYTTGSSIMPNKKNPDVVELLRASPSVVQGALAEIQSLLSLPSGYHRDLQATKGPLVRALAHGAEAVALLPALVGRMELDRARMAAAITPDLHATDVAVDLAREGVPFRTAYRRVADGLAELAARAPEDSLAARTSPGATADLMLGTLAERLAALRRR
jgi:argininosuccinate lyase